MTTDEGQSWEGAQGHAMRADRMYRLVRQADPRIAVASDKDGAKNSHTTLTQIIDAFPAMLDTYDHLWSSAHVERP